MTEIKEVNPNVLKFSTLFILCGLLLDSFSTAYIIRKPSFYELNPLIRMVFEYTGIYGIFVIKLLLVTIIIVCIINFSNGDKREYLLKGAGVIFGSIWLISGTWNVMIYVL